MIHELLGFTGEDVTDKFIELEDYKGESNAVYCADNPEEKKFLCFEPDKSDEANRKKINPEPRCDFLLVGKSDKSVRFIELKGRDKQNNDCRHCPWTWAHGFHQLSLSFNAYRHCYEPEDVFDMILCTSIPKAARKGRSANYIKYRHYKEIHQLTGKPPKVLYQGDIDEV